MSLKQSSNFHLIWSPHLFEGKFVKIMIPGNAGHQFQRNYTRRNNIFFHIVASISFVAFMFQQLLTELFLSHILVICIYRFGPQNYSRTKFSKFDRPTLARHYICNTSIGQYFLKSIFITTAERWNFSKLSAPAGDCPDSRCFDREMLTMYTN